MEWGRQLIQWGGQADRTEVTTPLCLLPCPRMRLLLGGVG